MAPKANILIIGGFGFIGLALARRILEKDKESRVILFGRKPQKDDALDALVRECGGRITIDPRDTERLCSEHSFKDVTQVYHLAARKVTTADKDADDVFEDNYFADSDVFYTFENRPDVKIVYASSCEVIGPLWERMRAEEGGAWPLPESFRIGSVDIYDPAGAYGISKIVGEMRLLHGKWDFKYAIARIASPYGPRMGDKTLIPVLMAAQRAEEGKPKVYVNDTRPYIYIDDVCDALMIIMQSSHTNGKIVAVAGPEQTIGNVAALIPSVVGGRRIDYFESIMRDAFMPGHVRGVAVTTLLELGWRPWVELDEGLRRTWDYYQHKL